MIRDTGSQRSFCLDAREYTHFVGLHALKFQLSKLKCRWGLYDNLLGWRPGYTIL